MWEGTCNYIEDQLQNGVGVKISNLGTITFKKIQLNIGRKNVVFTKPQFVLDEKMALYYGIKYGRPFNPGSLKTMVINCTQIAKSTNTSRDIVDNIIKDVVGTFWKVFLKRQRANFTVNNIGTVQGQGEFFARYEMYHVLERCFSRKN